MLLFLSLPLCFLQELEKSLANWTQNLEELQTMKTDLTQHILVEDVMVLKEQIELLHRQWEDLCLRVSQLTASRAGTAAPQFVATSPRATVERSLRSLTGGPFSRRPGRRSLRRQRLGGADLPLCLPGAPCRDGHVFKEPLKNPGERGRDRT